MYTHFQEVNKWFSSEIERIRFEQRRIDHLKEGSPHYKGYFGALEDIIEHLERAKSELLSLGNSSNSTKEDVLKILERLHENFDVKQKRAESDCPTDKKLYDQDTYVAGQAIGYSFCKLNILWDVSADKFPSWLTY